MKKKLVKRELLGNSPKPKSIFLWRIERQAGSWVLIYIYVALSICLHHGWKKSIVPLRKPEVQRGRMDIKDVWNLYLFLISTPCILGVISVIAKRPVIFEGIYLESQYYWAPNFKLACFLGAEHSGFWLEQVQTWGTHSLRAELWEEGRVYNMNGRGDIILVS